MRDIARRILESAGYEVIAVESGDAACRVAKEQSFDLALLDVVMPGLSCAETVARLRELRPRARLLLASGYTAGSNVVQPMANAKLVLIAKPYDPDELLRRVRHALEGRWSLEPVAQRDAERGAADDARAALIARAHERPR